jgi:integrase
MKGGYFMPRKGENIYKRKDGRWEGRYIKSKTSTGKAVYGYVYAKTYREVKAKLQNETVSVLQKTKLTPTTNCVSFLTMATEWLDSITPQVKISTVNKYRNLLQSYILPAYGELALNSITYDFIEKQCQELLLHGGSNHSGLSPKTVSDTLSVVRSILKFSIRKGEIIPCDGSGVSIKQEARYMRVFSRSEQEQLCDYLYSKINPCKIGILLSLFTGLRIGEVCALRWEDVSFSEQTIYVHHTLQRVQNTSENRRKTKIVLTTPKSACSIRLIPLPEPLVEILRDYKTVEKGYLLTNSDLSFIEPRTMQNQFKKVLKESGIESANFHALRHTFATRCIEFGFDVKSLSEILGHATINITMNRYVHPTLELKRANMKKLSQLLAVK